MNAFFWRPVEARLMEPGTDVVGLYPVIANGDTGWRIVLDTHAIDQEPEKYPFVDCVKGHAIVASAATKDLILPIERESFEGKFSNGLVLVGEVDDWVAVFVQDIVDFHMVLQRLAKATKQRA